MSEPETYDGTTPLANEGWERFCNELLLDPHASPGGAYERSGYKATGTVASAAASRLLKNVNVLARLDYLKAERKKRLGIDADRVLEELAVIAYQNLDHYEADENGNVTLREDAPKSAIRALSAIKRKIRIYRRGDEDVKEVDVEIKTWNKNTALQDLGKHLGLFGPKGTEEDPYHHTHTHDLGWADGPEADGS